MFLQEISTENNQVLSRDEQLEAKGLSPHKALTTLNDMRLDKELTHIYEGKYGLYTYQIFPELEPPKGSAIKSLFFKLPQNPNTQKDKNQRTKWLGKIGLGTEWYRENKNTLASWGTLNELRMNLESIQVKGIMALLATATSLADVDCLGDERYSIWH